VKDVFFLEHKIFYPFEGIVSSLFTHSHVFLNLYDFFFFCLLKNASIHTRKIKVVLYPTDLFYMFHRRKQVMQVQNDMRVTK